MCRLDHPVKILIRNRTLSVLHQYLQYIRLRFTSFLLVLRLLAGIDPRDQVNRVFGTVNNDLVVSSAIAWFVRAAFVAWIVRVDHRPIGIYPSHRKIGTTELIRDFARVGAYSKGQPS